MPHARARMLASALQRPPVQRAAGGTPALLGAAVAHCVWYTSVFSAVATPRAAASVSGACAPPGRRRHCSALGLPAARMVWCGFAKRQFASTAAPAVHTTGLGRMSAAVRCT